MQFWRLIFRESKFEKRRTCSIRVTTRGPTRNSRRYVERKYRLWQFTQWQFSLILLLHIGIRYSFFYIALLRSLTSTECYLGIGIWNDSPHILGFTATYFRTWVRISFPSDYLSHNSFQMSILFRTNATTLALWLSTNQSSTLISSGTSDRTIFRLTKRRLPCHFRSRSNPCLILNSKCLHQWLTVSMRLRSRKGELPAVNSTRLNACWWRLTHGSWGWLHWLVCCT